MTVFVFYFLFALFQPSGGSKWYQPHPDYDPNHDYGNPANMSLEALIVAGLLIVLYIMREVGAIGRGKPSPPPQDTEENQ